MLGAAGRARATQNVPPSRAPWVCPTLPQHACVPQLVPVADGGGALACKAAKEPPATSSARPIHPVVVEHSSLVHLPIPDQTPADTRRACPPSCPPHQQARRPHGAHKARSLVPESVPATMQLSMHSSSTAAARAAGRKSAACPLGRPARCPPARATVLNPGESLTYKKAGVDIDAGKRCWRPVGMRRRSLCWIGVDECTVRPAWCRYYCPLYNAGSPPPCSTRHSPCTPGPGRQRAPTAKCTIQLPPHPGYMCMYSAPPGDSMVPDGATGGRRVAAVDGRRAAGTDVGHVPWRFARTQSTYHPLSISSPSLVAGGSCVARVVPQVMRWSSASRR